MTMHVNVLKRPQGSPRNNLSITGFIIIIPLRCRGPAAKMLAFLCNFIPLRIFIASLQYCSYLWHGYKYLSGVGPVGGGGVKEEH